MENHRLSFLVDGYVVTAHLFDKEQQEALDKASPTEKKEFLEKIKNVFMLSVAAHSDETQPLDLTRFQGATIQESDNTITLLDGPSKTLFSESSSLEPIVTKAAKLFGSQVTTNLQPLKNERPKTVMQELATHAHVKPKPQRTDSHPLLEVDASAEEIRKRLEGQNL